MEMKRAYIHVYYCSNWNPLEKWATKVYEDVYYSPSREEAIKKAIDIWKSYLIKPKIQVHPFGKEYPHGFVITNVK